MRDFHVFIEQQGEQIYVGKITGSAFFLKVFYRKVLPGSV